MKQRSSRRSVASAHGMAAEPSTAYGDDQLRVIGLAEFLRTAELEASEPLPSLVHSTQSRFAMDILREGRLKTVLCNVYREKLCYLFVGRPAYKWNSESQASYWQLPITFVLRDADGAKLKRVHPFDTGAFASERVPDYILGFGKEAYDLGSSTEAAGAIIQALYGSVENYVRGLALSESELRSRHSLDVRHQEVEALARLYSDRSNTRADDRLRTIELQVTQDLSLSTGNLLGVVIPYQYARFPAIAAKLSALGCRVEEYGEYPINVPNYYGIVYERVQAIMAASSKR